MPHDAKGNLLNVGDTVNVRCQVREIHQTKEYCNVTLETNLPMFPTDQLSTVVLNAKQVFKVESEKVSPSSGETVLLTTALSRIAEVATAGEKSTTGDAAERFKWIRERAEHFAVTPADNEAELVALIIPTCGHCPFLDHSGAFTPGGAKAVCGHRNAVETFVTTVTDNDRHHWKYRQVDREAAPPARCPLRATTTKGDR